MINAWYELADPAGRRRIGKTLEEVNELGAVLARILIQGIDEVDPASGHTNRHRLMQEVADVKAQLILTERMFLGMSTGQIEARASEKIRQMGEWEARLSHEKTFTVDLPRPGSSPARWRCAMCKMETANRPGDGLPCANPDCRSYLLERAEKTTAQHAADHCMCTVCNEYCIKCGRGGQFLQTGCPSA